MLNRASYTHTLGKSWPGKKPPKRQKHNGSEFDLRQKDACAGVDDESCPTTELIWKPEQR